MKIAMLGREWACNGEADVKKLCKLTMEGFGKSLFFHMSVPCGYGKNGEHDFGTGIYRGVPFSIETKFGGTKPTPGQTKWAQGVTDAEGFPFLIDEKNVRNLTDYILWLKSQSEMNDTHSIPTQFGPWWV